jgi:hypothetical protein
MEDLSDNEINSLKAYILTNSPALMPYLNNIYLSILRPFSGVFIDKHISTRYQLLRSPRLFMGEGETTYPLFGYCSQLIVPFSEGNRASNCNPSVPYAKFLLAEICTELYLFISSFIYVFALSVFALMPSPTRSHHKELACKKKRFIILARTINQVVYARRIISDLERKDCSCRLLFIPSATSLKSLASFRVISLLTSQPHLTLFESASQLINGINNYVRSFGHFPYFLYRGKNYNFCKAIRHATLKSIELKYFEAVLRKFIDQPAFGCHAHIVHFELYSPHAYIISEIVNTRSMECFVIQTCDLISFRLPLDFTNIIFLAENQLCIDIINNSQSSSSKPKECKLGGSVRIFNHNSYYGGNDQIRFGSHLITYCTAPRSYDLQREIIRGLVSKLPDTNQLSLLLHPRDSKRHYAKCLDVPIIKTSLKQNQLACSKLVITPPSAIILELLSYDVPFLCIPFDNVDVIQESLYYSPMFKGFANSNTHMIELLDYALHHYGDFIRNFNAYKEVIGAKGISLNPFHCEVLL